MRTATRRLLAGLALLLPAAAAATPEAGRSPVRVAEVLCDGRQDPVGVDPTGVRFSWVMESDARGQAQGAWHLEVASSRGALLAGKPDVWDSGRVVGRDSLLVPYAGPSLEPARAYFWRVQVEDAAGRLTDWSAPARFVTALRDAADWGEARWIGYEDMPERERLVPGLHSLRDPELRPKLKRPVVPLLRRVFTVRKPVARALLFVSGLGHYEAYLNGEKVGDRFLAPGWTDYDHTVLYDAFDVTDALRAGPNAIAAIVGNGFHHVAPERYTKLAIAYGWPKLLAALRIEYADGLRETVSTGPAWKAAPSPITFTSIYGGEDFDARLEPEGWARVDFDDAGWGRAVAVSPPAGRLQIETDHPLRVMEVLQPVSVKPVGPGVVLYDFGQNASGIVRLRVRGEGGRTVTLTPSELLTPDGRPNQKASGEPYRWTYTLRGGSEEAWAPRFTYYGFRYVEVEGAVPAGADGPAGLPRIVSIEMAHTRNAAPEAGRFETSLPLFDRIFTLVRWAIRSNLASVLTDCPHREKLGWLEQTYLMGEAVHFDYDLFGLYRKQVADIVDAQADGRAGPRHRARVRGVRGGLPRLAGVGQRRGRRALAPLPLVRRPRDAGQGLADDEALRGLPGDEGRGAPAVARPGRLVRPGPSIPRRGAADPEGGDGHGDLLPRPAPRRADREGARAPRRRRALRGPCRERPHRVQPGILRPGTATWSTGNQTALAMPLVVGLAPDGEEGRVQDGLVRRIEKDGRALTAGDIGFHYVVEALSRAGRGDLLFAMNARDDVPGYGFQLKKGATALTESWAALEEVSNNHLMLGHLVRWFYAGLLGIDQQDDSVGYASSS